MNPFLKDFIAFKKNNTKIIVTKKLILFFEVKEKL
jgi:hypothetical protein